MTYKIFGNSWPSFDYYKIDLLDSKSIFVSRNRKHFILFTLSDLSYDTVLEEFYMI